jgi:hypothetical protein
MARLSPISYGRLVDTDGTPRYATLTTLVAGGTVNLTAYQDADATTAHANPVVTDSYGVMPAVYLQNASYKFVLRIYTASGGTLLQTITLDDVADGLDVSADVTALGLRVDAAETDVSTLESTTLDNAGNVTALDTRVEANESDIAAIQIDTANLNAQFTLGSSFYVRNTLATLTALTGLSENDGGFASEDGSNSGFWRYNGSAWVQSVADPSTAETVRATAAEAVLQEAIDAASPGYSNSLMFFGLDRVELDVAGYAGEYLTVDGNSPGSTTTSSEAYDPSYDFDNTFVVDGDAADTATYYPDNPAITYIVAVLGQSNAYGFNLNGVDDTIYNGSAPYSSGLKMPSSGLRVDGTRFDSLIALTETGGLNPAETCATSFARHLLYNINYEIPAIATTTERVAVFVSAKSSQPFYNLHRGSPQYQNWLKALRDCANAIRDGGRIPVYLCSLWVQGEREEFYEVNEYQYANKLKTLARNLNDDAKAVTGQTQSAMLYPVSTNIGVLDDDTDSGADFKEIANSPIIACKESDLIPTAVPMYMYPLTDADELHLENVGQTRMGQNLAQAVLNHQFGPGDQGAFCIREGYRLSATETVLDYDVPNLPIVEDTAAGSPRSHVTDTTSSVKGFRAYNIEGNTMLSISSVAVYTGSDKAGKERKLLLTHTSCTGPIRIRYAQRRDGGSTYNGNGPVFGGRGTIRDSLADAGLATGDTSYSGANYALPQTFTVSGI